MSRDRDNLAACYRARAQLSALAGARPQLTAVDTPAEWALYVLSARLQAVEHAAERRLDGVAEVIEQTVTEPLLAALSTTDIGRTFLLVEQASTDLYQRALDRKLIQAEGRGVGVLTFRRGRLLLGFRHGAHGAHTWGLPGGHVEDGESAEQAAVREGAEETGQQLIVIPADLPSVYMYSPEKQRLYRDEFVVAATDDPATLTEPDRCLQWRYCDPQNLPEPLFFPLAEAIRRGLNITGLAASR